MNSATDLKTADLTESGQNDWSRWTGQGGTGDDNDDDDDGDGDDLGYESDKSTWKITIPDRFCDRCQEIPLNAFFPTSIEGKRRPCTTPMVVHYPIDVSKRHCLLCQLLWGIVCRIGGPRVVNEKAINRFFLCLFRPPPGVVVLSPSNEVACTVVRLVGDQGDDKDEAKFRRWELDPNSLPWTATEFADLCSRGCVIQVRKRNPLDYPTFNRLYTEVDMEQLRRFVAASPLPTKDGKFDKPLCDLAPGFQLIDCHSRRIVSLKERGEYVTLSYVWGCSSTNTQAQTADPTRLPHSLPRVIEDSIRVTATLGFRYLWVDRYCIPQNDPQARHGQIKRMGDIYSASILTIVAAAGNGPEHGLPGISRPSVLPPQLRLYGPNETSIGLYTFGPVKAAFSQGLVLPDIGSDPLREELETSEWNSRGWTLQEAILSTRRLVFTPSFIYFQGPSAMPLQQEPWAFERGKVMGGLFLNPPERQLQSDRRNMRTSGSLHGETGYLSKFAEDYLGRRLTYDRDAYAAFSGIQSLCQRVMGDTWYFFYGLQIKRVSYGCEPNREWLGAALLWKFWGRLSSVSRRPGVPSWTWLGWKFGRTGEAYGPSWPRDNMTLFSAQFGSMEFIFSDGFVVDWRDMFKPLPVSVSDDIPSLRISGWTFPAEDLVAQKLGFGLSQLQDAGNIFRMLCLVIGYSKSTKPVVLVLVLCPKARGASYQRVHIDHTKLNTSWDRCDKGSMGWVKRTVVIS
ncbi:hypothetical protein OQA88_11833 [Cercophora sp. LCS_1]